MLTSGFDIILKYQIPGAQSQKPIHPQVLDQVLIWLEDSKSYRELKDGDLNNNA